MGLNEQQSAVVAAPSGGVVQVCALAGSGKSHTLIHRAEALLAGNLKKLIILAFNKRIQTEMSQKVDSRLPASVKNRITVQTSHSFGLRMVRDYLSHLEHLVPVPAIEVLAQDWKVQKLAKETLLKCRVPVSKKDMQPVVKALLAIGDLQRSVGPEDFTRLTARFNRVLMTLKEIGINSPLPLAKALYEARYELGQLAFSDMIPLAVQLDNSCYRQLGYDYVMVDEAQDLNQVQHQMVEKLYRAGEGLTLVGDEFQSIYSFSGAAPHVFMAAPQRYGASVYPMEWNYRSSPRILHYANALLQDALASPLALRPGLSDMDEYPDPWILDKSQTTLSWLRYIQGRLIPLNEVAILYRANKQSLGLELTMIANKIPYQAKTGGFLSLPVVKDILSYLMAVLQPSEDWWDTVVSHVRFLGKDTATSSYGKCLFDDEKRPWKHNPETLRTHSMKQSWQELAEFMEATTVQTAAGSSLRDVTNAIVDRLHPVWTERHADDPDAFEDAMDVAAATADWLRSMSDREELLAVMGDRKKLTSDNGVTLSTIHRAKGLEWDAVLLAGLGDNTFIRVLGEISDEEFRLAYVAFTRARKYLTLSIAGDSHNGGILCTHLRSVYYPDSADPESPALDSRYDPTLLAEAVAV